MRALELRPWRIPEPPPAFRELVERELRDARERAYELLGRAPAAEAAPRRALRPSRGQLDADRIRESERRLAAGEPLWRVAAEMADEWGFPSGVALLAALRRAGLREPIAA